MVEMRDDFDPFTLLGTFTADRLQAEDFETEEEKAIAGAIENRFEEARNAKTWRQQIADYNELILKGETLIGRTRIDNEVLRIIRDGDPRQLRSTDNIILAIHRAFVGKFTRAVPRSKASARSSDREDMLAADVMDSFNDFFFMAQKMRVKYKRWVEGISKAGTGIIRLFWDRDKGPVVGVCKKCDFASRDATPGNPCPQCAQEQQMAAEAQMGMMPLEQQEPSILEESREGDLCADVVQYRDFYPDPGARAEPETMQWCFVTDTLHVAKLRKMFPDRAHVIHAEDGLFSDRYIFAPQGLASARIEVRELENHAQLKTYYEMPSGLHAKGRIIYVANGRILGVHDCIEGVLLGRLPFYFARGDIDEDTLWGMDIISQAEPQQRERDTLVTRLRQWRDLTLNPRAVKSIRSGIHIKRLTTKPGEFITGNAVDESNFRFLRVPDLPSYVPNELVRLHEAAREKFGVTSHELGLGDPGESGRYAAILESQSSETIGPLVIEVNEEWTELWRGVLVLGRHYMSSDRIWTAVSKGRVLTRSWSEANILPGWDVYLANVDSISRNPILREQAARERMQLGYYTDASTGRIDWDRYRLDAGIEQAVTTSDSEASEHIRAAELPRIIEEAMLNQQPLPQPQPWDNAFIFASELQDWLRSNSEAKPEPIRRAVAQLWFLYAMSLMPEDPSMPMDPQVMEVMPNQKFMQSMMQPAAGPGPGGSAPGQQLGMPQRNQEVPGQATPADETVRNADQQAESAARQTSRHES